jgi:hypothetical protein
MSDQQGGAMSMPRTRALCVIGALMAASPALAHHDWQVDRTKQVTLQGTVTAFSWGNPHVMIALDVPPSRDALRRPGQANGTIEKWKVGGSSPQFMAACGWDKKALRPGDVITVIGSRFKDGSNAARLLTVVMPDGKEMYYGAPPSRAADCVPLARVPRPAPENGVP